MKTVGQFDVELEKCFRVQRKLAAISYKYPDKRFKDLYNLTYWKPFIYTALKIVRSRSGAKTAGVDGKTKYDINDEKYLQEIQLELKHGLIKPSAVRKVDIPKDNGKTRTLSIATYKDRVILTIIKLIIEPIFEPHFNASSYGFRPEMSTHDAIGEIRLYLGNARKYSWIIETDIQACFDRIHRGRLLEILIERIADMRLIQLIRAYVYENIGFEGFPDYEYGCAQGSPLSPLLCNIYLDKLDKYVNNKYHREQQVLEKGKELSSKPANMRRRRAYLGTKDRQERTGPFHLIRYADDLVILSPASKENVQKYMREVQEYLWNRLRLKLAPEKTKIVHAKDGFSFLGFHVKRKYMRQNKNYKIIINVDPKRKERHKDKIRKTLKGNHNREVSNVIKAVNAMVRGWRNYYQRSLTNCHMLHYIDDLTFWLLIKWLMKKYKANISTIFKTFYGYVTLETYNRVKRIRHNNVYLLAASLALPKHQIDYTQRMRHPWLSKKNAVQMLKSVFPIQPRAPTWDGTSSLGETYAKMRQKTLARDGYKCRKCSSKTNLEVHHLNKRASYDNPKGKAPNNLENLVTLCDKCHKHANHISAIECIYWLLN